MLTEISGSRELSAVVGVAEDEKWFTSCGEFIFIFVPERTVLFRLVTHSKVVSNFDSESDYDSDAYFAIAPPEMPISLRSSL